MIRWRGGAGNNYFIGGPGDDSFRGGAGIDTVSYETVTGGGITVTLSGQGGWGLLGGLTGSFTGGGDSGNDFPQGAVFIENVTGTNQSDTIAGNRHDTVLIGLGGNDNLDGGADVFGDSGNDTLIGGAGIDQLNGRLGSDTFVWQKVTDAPTGGTIEFATVDASDQFDFSAIDANGASPGDPAFVYATSGTAAGTLVVSGTTIVGHVDGDGVADFQINLSATVSETQFIL